MYQISPTLVFTRQTVYKRNQILFDFQTFTVKKTLEN